jgi:hypothetical protein
MIAEIGWLIFGNDIVKGADQVWLEAIILLKDSSSCNTFTELEEMSVVDVQGREVVMGKAVDLGDVVFVCGGNTRRGDRRGRGLLFVSDSELGFLDFSLRLFLPSFTII